MRFTTSNLVLGQGLVFDMQPSDGPSVRVRALRELDLGAAGEVYAEYAAYVRAAAEAEAAGPAVGRLRAVPSGQSSLAYIDWLVRRGHIERVGPAAAISMMLPPDRPRRMAYRHER